MSSNNDIENVDSDRAQFATFMIEDHIYGIDVVTVQEVVRALPITRVPRAPEFVRGLINLRGQVATAIGVRELFGLVDDFKGPPMNVVCGHSSGLLALQVDSIGDVIEVPKSNFEITPLTISGRIRQFMPGVYKTDSDLLSILDLNAIMDFVNKGRYQD